MPSTQEFRRRIKSVNNTKQITKAMEMIASIKMQKAVKTIGQARSYVHQAWNILQELAPQVLPENHPLILPHEKTGRIAIILITSDRGLCGSYNSEIIRKFVEFSNDYSKQTTDYSNNIGSRSSVDGKLDRQIDVISVGKVGAKFIKNYGKGNLIAEFKAFENNIDIGDIVPISKLTNGEYLAGKYDRVVAIYSHFASTLKQVPVAQQILPIVGEHIDKPELWIKGNNRVISSNSERSHQNQNEISHRQTTDRNDKLNTDYKFEPKPQEVFDAILIQIIRTQIFGAVLEANASEHSARMMAMSNATENAEGLIKDLTLIYNSVRQDSITREIAEISAAAESMK